MSAWDPDQWVIIEVDGERTRVEEVLNQLASTCPEKWRKIYRKRKSTYYRGRGCYKVDFQGDEPEECCPF